MTWFFMIPLAIALAVTVLFRSAVDEAAYLAGSIALVNLLVSLMIAPWQIKALVVLLIVLSSHHLLQAHSQRPVDSQVDEKLTLTDRRGIESKVAPPAVKVSDVEGTGKYRGQVWENRSVKNAEEVTTAIKYQGVSVQRKIPVASVMSKDIHFFG